MQNPSVAQQQDANPLGPHFNEQLRQQIRQQIRQSMQAAQAERAAAQAQLQTQQGGPVVLVPPNNDNFIPSQATDIAYAFFLMIVLIIVGLPLARAMARRLDRKPVRQEIDPGLTSQLQRIEHTVDAMAIEVERISEAQRYMARLQTERADPAALPSRQTTPQ